MPQPQPRFDPDGVEYYNPDAEEAKNAGFQSYYAANAEAIARGEVPARYEVIARLVPGDSVLEIGSADGVQSLTLARHNKRVCGVEMMPMQFAEAQALRDRWLAQGIDVSSCTFVNSSAMDALDHLDNCDTVLMSRVLYHLRGDIKPLFERIADSGVRSVVLIGCPLREARWRERGETGDSMGRYAYYAAQEGMEDILREFGFDIARSIPSQNGEDPVVIGTRTEVSAR